MAFSLKQFEVERKENVEILRERNPDRNLWYKNKTGYLNEEIDITSIFTAERIEELRNCKLDEKYFIENYLKIQSVDKDKSGSRIIPFKLRKYQSEQIDLFENKRFVGLLYPRRSGKTIATIGYFLHKLLFEENFTIICLANKDKVAMKIIKTLKMMLRNLPLWLQTGIEKFNQHEIVFENGSAIQADATTPDSGRSEGANIVYIDECAFISDSIWNEFYTSVYPVISGGKTTKLLMTSTPNGRNHFWHMYRNATLVDRKMKTKRKGKSNFYFKKIKWNEVPGRDEEFKKETIANLVTRHGLVEAKRQWKQDYECSFLGSVKTLVDFETIDKWVVNETPNEQRINCITLENYIFRVHNPPEIGKNYIIIHDPSEGLGGNSDDTGIIVFDASNPEKGFSECATLNDNKIDDKEAPSILVEIAKLYNNALIVNEINKLPSIPRDIFEKEGYENVYYDMENKRYGLKTTKSTRPSALSLAKKYLKKEKIIINDYETKDEFFSFVKKGKRFEAETGTKDDLVICVALFAYFISDEFRWMNYISDVINYKEDFRNIDVEIGFDDGIKRKINKNDEFYDNIHEDLLI